MEKYYCYGLEVNSGAKRNVVCDDCGDKSISQTLIVCGVGVENMKKVCSKCEKKYLHDDFYNKEIKDKINEENTKEWMKTQTK